MNIRIHNIYAQSYKNLQCEWKVDWDLKWAEIRSESTFMTSNSVNTNGTGFFYLFLGSI